ncbi:MAG: membrane integrity-associated transporter subunit PqiC [Candidatus Schekmanbacteria bacterium]|nr:membrane integrity-associated transporter subunit PqiC [Candidatus Schekmanbacteria bacterium]
MTQLKPALAPVAVVVIVALAACSRPVPNTHFYQLAVPSAVAGPFDPEAAPLEAILALAPVTSVSALRASEIAYVATSTEVVYFAYHRWVDTPERLTEERLIQDLSRAGRFRAVVSNNPTAAATHVLICRLLGFHEREVGGVAHGVVALDVELRAATGGPPLLRRAYEVARPAGSAAPAAVVIAINEAIDELSGRLIADISTALSAPPDAAQP